MMQLSLLDYTPRARRSDPATSHHAAKAAAKFQGEHHKKILAHLQAIYPASAHYVAIALATGLERHAVGRRLAELDRAGLIVQDGSKALPNGNPARSWKLAHPSVPELRLDDGEPVQ